MMGHQVEPDPAEMAARYETDMPVAIGRIQSASKTKTCSVMRFFLCKLNHHMTFIVRKKYDCCCVAVKP
jgi:hypothetical protein